MPVKRIGVQVIAEFIGTMLFVFIGCGSVVLFGLVVSQQNPTLVAVGLVPIALATGLGMAVLISNTGHISGGHHNPAVTISIWVAGKIDAVRAGLYVVAQLAGAAAGTGLLALILPSQLWNRTHLGTPEVNLHPFNAFSFSTGRAVFLEAVLTFILVYTVFATAVDDRGSFKTLSGLPIGLAIAVDIHDRRVLHGRRDEPGTSLRARTDLQHLDELVGLCRRPDHGRHPRGIRVLVRVPAEQAGRPRPRRVGVG